MKLTPTSLTPLSVGVFPELTVSNRRLGSILPCEQCTYTPSYTHACIHLQKHEVLQNLENLIRKYTAAA